jgi:hypothetical protein
MPKKNVTLHAPLRHGDGMEASMVRSDKLEGTGHADEGEEIDRIMKEIEDLEKKMDTEPVAEASAPAKAPATATTPATTAAPPTGGALDDLDDSVFAESSKVVPMRPPVATRSDDVGESLAETDAVPARDEPLVKNGSSSGDGGLSLKIGGCTEVNLEFTRSGMSVSLSCSDEGLVISTDQGAEFRIPFKRSA